MFRQSLALAAALLLSLPVVAQSIQVGQGRDQKTIQLIRTATPPVIDGVLDDAVWANAAFIDEFHQIIPVEYAEPTERTEVRVLFDDDALYVGVKMFIDPSMITANILKQNTTIFGSDDYFSISFDSFNTKRGGYFFGVNPNGVRADGLYRNISQFYADWDGIYEAKTSIVADGWIAEFEIPFKSISFDPNIDTWGMNFSRRVQVHNEQVVWVSNDRRFDPSSAGLATGLVGLRQGLGLDIVPSTSITQERNFATNNTEALRADEARSRQIMERIPAGRWGDPEDMGGAAVFLASKASDYVQGHILAVDGGWLAR